MYKLFLNFRKIRFVLIILTIFNLLTFASIYAETTAESITKESDGSINIEIPSENIKKIPIIGYKFVYQEYNASLIDFLKDKIIELRGHLASVGIKEKNIVIIYTNYLGKTLDRSLIYNYKEPELDTSINYSNYSTGENICLNLTNLLKKYSLPFLTAKRKVLVGTLVNNYNLFRGNENLKVTTFNFPDAKAISLYKTTTDNPLNESEDSGSSSSCNKRKVKSDFMANYSYEELILYRSNMISYMNLGIFKNVELIGMMEYRDLVNRCFSYFVLQGNLNNFLFPKNN